MKKVTITQPLTTIRVRYEDSSSTLYPAKNQTFHLHPRRMQRNINQFLTNSEVEITTLDAQSWAFMGLGKRIK